MALAAFRFDADGMRHAPISENYGNRIVAGSADDAVCSVGRFAESCRVNKKAFASPGPQICSGMTLKALVRTGDGSLGLTVPSNDEQQRKKSDLEQVNAGRLPTIDLNRLGWT